MNRSTVVASLLLSPLFMGAVWVDQGVDQQDSARLDCTVHTVRSQLKLGEYPRAWVEIRNTSERPVWLVGTLDGSSWRGRYPHAYFEIEGPPGGVEKIGLGVCGTLNPLRSRDFVLLQPGASFNPHGVGDGDSFFPDSSLGTMRLVRPGTYTIVFHYSTNEVDPSRWMGSVAALPPDLAEELQQVPRLTLRCTSEIRVNPK